MMRTINNKQKEIVMYNHDWNKEAIRNMKDGITPDEYHIFLSGPGGTRKPHVRKLIYHDAVHIFRNTNAIDPEDTSGYGRNPKDPTALLTAYTGTAAFNAKVTILQTAFKLKSERISVEKRV